MRESSAKNLVVVAHPDDETIFMAGHILKYKAIEWEILCVTDANGDGRGAIRMEEFDRACKSLKAKNLGTLNYPDVFDARLNWEQLEKDLSPRLGDYERIWTHGPLGEYGHIHHQDVSRGVHEAGLKEGVEVWSFAYNSKPDLVTELSSEFYGKKLKILIDCYGSEVHRFLNLLNCSYGEGFSKLDITELRSIHEFLATKAPIKELLPHFGLLKPWIENGKYFESLEAFFANYFREA